MEEANAVLQEYLPRFNQRFALAAEQPETAYRPVPEDLSLSETVSIKHTRKVARDNTVKYQWRVLQLMPGAERPSYAGLRVDLLERADGELMVRYQGQMVDFQEGETPTASLWGEGTAVPPCRINRILPVAWPAATWMKTSGSSWPPWSPQWRSGSGRGKQPGRLPKACLGKKNRYATNCTASLPLPSRPGGRRCSRPRVGDCPCGLSPGNWAWPRTPSANTLKAESPPTKLLSAKERAKAEALTQVPIAAD